MNRKFGLLAAFITLLISVTSFSLEGGEELEGLAWAPNSSTEGRWSSGLDIIIAKPLYSNNLALRDSSQVSSQQLAVQNVEFNYDFETSPRLWVGYESSSAIGVRAGWWQYANQANALSLTPSANGFGRVEHPAFGDVDISAITPTERMLADASLDVYTIDLELTRRADLGAGTILVSGGIRFASLDQNYSARLMNANSIVAGAIDYQQHVRGLGPTVSASFARYLTDRWQWFATGRGSLLMGEGEEQLNAGEDLDFINPQRTTEIGSRDQLLPIVDMQLGTSYIWRRQGRFQPAFRGGWEMSWWGDVGNNSGGSSDLGFAGFFIGLEGTW